MTEAELREIETVSGLWPSTSWLSSKVELLVAEVRRLQAQAKNDLVALTQAQDERDALQAKVDKLERELYLDAGGDARERWADARRQAADQANLKDEESGP